MKKEKHPILGNVYRFENSEEEAMGIINRIIAPYEGLVAEMLPPEIMSRGVQGDEGTYTRVILLKGTLPKREVLQEISSQISNAIPVNRVIVEL